MLKRNLAVVGVVVVRYRHCRFNNHTIKPFKSEDLLYDE